MLDQLTDFRALEMDLQTLLSFWTTACGGPFSLDSSPSPTDQCPFDTWGTTYHPP